MSTRRLITVVVLLLVTAVLVNFPVRSKDDSSRTALASSFQDLDRWRGVDEAADEGVISALRLDDYLIRRYSDGTREVDLYVGYYRTSVKTAAAHSPLVCFPGQGWVLEGERRVSTPVHRAGANWTVNGVSMTAKREGLETRVFFWYQAWTSTFPDTFRQKLSLFWDRLRYGQETNALVRVSTPIRAGNVLGADQVLADFLEAFYPAWHSYVAGGQASALD